MIRSGRSTVAASPGTGGPVRSARPGSPGGRACPVTSRTADARRQRPSRWSVGLSRARTLHLRMSIVSPTPGLAASPPFHATLAPHFCTEDQAYDRACGGDRRRRSGRMLAGELALAGIDVVVVERRTNHEGDGSHPGGLPSRAVAARPGACGKPVVVRQGSAAQREAREARRG